MAAASTFLAFDLGAESGRSFLGSFDGGHISLREVHRFPNVPVRVMGNLYWDVLRLFGEVKVGLGRASAQGPPESMGIDAWAVDFGLLDRYGALVSNPHHYRDARTDGMMDLAFRQVDRSEIYARTGIQFMQINTLYQLLAMRGSPSLEIADDLLLIPDLLNYWLTGEKACEFTNATTTQLLNAGAGDWDWNLMEKMGIPHRVFPRVIHPAAELGTLRPDVAGEVGTSLRVLTVASHDTASAVVAVPAEGEEFAYISSGTWSLVGVETPEPVVTREAMEANFTNEGGFGGKTRLLKNVMGLWLLQECRRSWARKGREYSYEELEALAEEATAFGPLVDPDHPSFLAPGDMPARIRRFCEASGQRPPEGPGEIARCVFESLALKYRLAVERARELAGKPLQTVHVVGGGSQNRLLCQLTADASGLPVLAGPVEATALGNVMVQAFASGLLDSPDEIRTVVRGSFKPRIHEPSEHSDRWVEAREKFSNIVETAARADVSAGG